MPISKYRKLIGNTVHIGLGSESFTFDINETFIRSPASAAMTPDANRLDHPRVESFETRLRALCAEFGLTIQQLNVLENRSDAAVQLPQITIGLEQQPRIPDEIRQWVIEQLADRERLARDGISCGSVEVLTIGDLK